MPLQPGERLGPYEVLSALGAGGMGEVWRARDIRLARDVALKVLPAAFVADPERLARFEREAKVLASLNHPHIGGIHGLEEADGVRALVLELVEGPTLADRIERGPIPIDEALPIARQIAEALEAAHEQGIVHRDLKPANIKVRPDGTVKVLDFGLAKALQPPVAAAEGALSQSPTLSLTAAATRTGVILGTAAYMAPEQARGMPVDKRADVWAFGCVLYEMLTGRRAFAGADLSETLARVLEREPDWSALPGSTPPGVVRVLQRSLRRDLDDRLHDIADARIELEEAGSTAEVASATASPLSHRNRALLGAAFVAAMIVVAAVAVFTSTRWRGASRPSPTVTFSIPALHGGRVTQLSTPPALSPDGKQIAFYAPNESGAPVLWIRPLDSLVPRALPGTERTFSPFWSPDGDAVAFAHLGGGLWRVDVAGGSPQKITDVTLPRSGTWSRTGDIVFWSAGGEGLLHRVAATGGPVTPVTRLSEQRREVLHMYPHFLPDGRRFLYLAVSLDDRYSGVYAGSLDGGETTFVAPLASRAEYADGYLVFGSGPDLFAQPFDLDALKLAGDRSRIGERVGVAWGSFHNFDFATAPGGVVAYRPGSFLIDRSQLVLTNAAGDVVQNLGAPYYTYSMALSPDGKRLALEVANADNKSADIWIMDVPGASMNRLTSATGGMRTFSVPVWSPSGDRVLATSFTGQLWLMRPDRPSAPSEPLPHELGGVGGFPTDWSHDGRYVVADRWDPTTSTDIWLLPTDAEGSPEVYATSRYQEASGRVSPDGAWLAYMSRESGRPQIMLDTFPQPTRRTVVTSASGEWPRWSRDGRALYYYYVPERAVMRASLSFEGDLPQVADPEPLFRLTSGLANVEPSRSPWEVLGDGEQFIFNLEVPEEGSDAITVVLNWPAALKR